MNGPALVAVAHGSRDPAAARSVAALLDDVRRRRPGLEVLAAYLDHTEPRLDACLASIRGPAVVVPLLLTAAFHSSVDIPAQMAGAADRAVQAEVLGPHDALLDGLGRRLEEAGVRRGEPGTAIVLAAAGSTDPAAVQTVRELAARWATRGWWAVEAAFASAAGPTAAEAVAMLRRRGAPRVALASYLLWPGLFADRLAAVGGADAVSAPLGAAPEVGQVVLERYDAALSGGV